MWKSLTISVGDAAQLPVVRGDVPFFREVLESLARGGRFECAITGRVLGGDGCLAGVASFESKEVEHMNASDEMDMVDAREALREESYSRRHELAVFETEEVGLFVYCLCLFYKIPF